MGFRMISTIYVWGLGQFHSGIEGMCYLFFSFSFTNISRLAQIDFGRVLIGLIGSLILL